jgi:hypothetical protein
VLDQLSDQWSVDLVRVTVLVAVVLSGGALLQHTIQYLTNDTHPPVTYRLLLLPGLHRRLVLLEFVTPIRVDLLVVVALSRRRTPVSVHRHVVRTEKGRPHPAVVPSGVALRHGDDHQTVFRSLDVLVRSTTIAINFYRRVDHTHSILPVLDLVAALLFGIVVPGDRLRRQNRRHLEEAAQMQALAPSHHHLLLDDAAVAHVHGAVRDVLQQPETSRLRRDRENWNTDPGEYGLHTLESLSHPQYGSWTHLKQLSYLLLHITRSTCFTRKSDATNRALCSLEISITWIGSPGVTSNTSSRIDEVPSLSLCHSTILWTRPSSGRGGQYEKSTIDPWTYWFRRSRRCSRGPHRRCPP